MIKGEIDIIENVNQKTNDISTLHTKDGCNFKNAPKNYTGHSYNDDCYGNVGCGIGSPSSASFGAPFNDKRG